MHWLSPKGMIRTVGETCEYTFSTIVLKRIIRYIDLCFTVLTLLGE